MKSRTLISFCHRPGLNPCHAAITFTGAISYEALVAIVVLLTFPVTTFQLSPSSDPVWRAIISSSLVGITQAETLLCGREIRGPLLWFASASSSTPSHPQASQI